MGHDHGASHANERRLWIVLTLTTAFMVAEVVGGLLTSLASRCPSNSEQHGCSLPFFQETGHGPRAFQVLHRIRLDIDCAEICRLAVGYI